MTSAPSATATRAESWRSRRSALTRVLLGHERLLACSIALLTALVAFEPRVRGGGLAADDWALYAGVKFPHALGFHSSLDAMQSSAGSRVGAILYWLASFSLFGAHTRFYAALAALLAVLMAFSIYVLLRELRFSVAQSLAMMLLTLAAPFVETERFWFTPSGSQLSLALFFFGLTLALRAFSTTGRGRRILHIASWSLYVLSAVYAEVALPLIGVCVLVYLTRAPLKASVRRWAFDLIVVIGGYLATSAFISSEAAFTKLPRAMWGEHARLIGDQALTIFTREVDPFLNGSRLPDLVVLAILAVGGVLFARSPHTSVASRQALKRWAFAFFVSLVAIVAAYAAYIPAFLYYEPLGPGLPSHIDIVIAAPLAIGVFAVLMFAGVVLAELLDRVRPDLGRFAVALVIVWFAVIFVTGVRDVRNDGRIWSFAGDRDARILGVMTAKLPHPVPGSTTYTFGEGGAAAPGLPLFYSSFELTSAVKTAYGRGDVSAYPVVDEDDTVKCGPTGIAVYTGSSPLNAPSPYGKSYFLDIPTGVHQRIDSAADCTDALSQFHSGPYYAGTTLHWSQ